MLVFIFFLSFFFFFFNDTATTEIYTLSLHDALPIAPRSVPEKLSMLYWHERSLKSASSTRRLLRRSTWRRGRALACRSSMCQPPSGSREWRKLTRPASVPTIRSTQMVALGSDVLGSRGGAEASAARCASSGSSSERGR